MDTKQIDFTKAIAAAGEHVGKVIQLLVDGVAFRENGNWYRVFSHEGDLIGRVTTNDLGYAISFMKRQGRAVGKVPHPTFISNNLGHIEPSFTFAWEGWFMLDGVRL